MKVPSNERLFAFEPMVEFQLSDVTCKRNHGSVHVHVGTTRIRGKQVPTAIVGHLLSMIFGLSYENSISLGERIRGHLAQAKPNVIP